MNFHFFLLCPQLGFRLRSGIHQIYPSFQSMNRNVNETEWSVDPWLHSTSSLLVLFVFQEPHLILIRELFRFQGHSHGDVKVAKSKYRCIRINAHSSLRVNVACTVFTGIYFAE